MNPLTNFKVNFTEQRNHAYEVKVNLMETGGWTEEQDPTCFLQRTLLKLNLYVVNKFI